MAVTPETIAVELGRPTPAVDSVQSKQWQGWIDEALYLIGRRLTLADLDAADVDYVVKHSILPLARNPDGATQVDVAIDDGRVSRRYSGANSVSISDELWAILDPTVETSGAHSVTPFFAPDVWPWP